MGCFTVTADGSAIAVSSVTIASTYIILTLASPVTYGQTVTLTIDRDGTNYPRANSDGSSKMAVPVVRQVSRITPTPPLLQPCRTLLSWQPNQQTSPMKPQQDSPGSVVFPRHLGRGNMGAWVPQPVPAYRQEQA